MSPWPNTLNSSSDGVYIGYCRRNASCDMAPNLAEIDSKPGHELDKSETVFAMFVKNVSTVTDSGE